MPNPTECEHEWGLRDWCPRCKTSRYGPERARELEASLEKAEALNGELVAALEKLATTFRIGTEWQSTYPQEVYEIALTALQPGDTGAKSD